MRYVTAQRPHFGADVVTVDITAFNTHLFFTGAFSASSIWTYRAVGVTIETSLNCIGLFLLVKAGLIVASG
uniref:hypothetical protein n=1 Tax=Klebsiella michiganensis TaxID=1134687 RepID=UPI0005B485EA|nr:hypothetical protein [Klebsiella michiganensis]